MNLIDELHAIELTQLGSIVVNEPKLRKWFPISLETGIPLLSLVASGWNWWFFSTYSDENKRRYEGGGVNSLRDSMRADHLVGNYSHACWVGAEGSGLMKSSGQKLRF